MADEKYDLEQENQSLSRRFTKDASELQNVIRTLRQQVEELELENSQNIADEKNRSATLIHQLERTIVALRSDLEKSSEQFTQQLEEERHLKVAELGVLQRTIATIRNELEDTRLDHEQQLQYQRNRSQAEITQLQNTVSQLREQMSNRKGMRSSSGWMNGNVPSLKSKCCSRPLLNCGPKWNRTALNTKIK